MVDMSSGIKAHINPANLFAEGLNKCSSSYILERGEEENNLLNCKQIHSYLNYPVPINKARNPKMSIMHDISDIN